MSYGDDELIPISALQHFVFCSRQCALIHIERLWADNRYTVEGHQLHAKAHQPAGRKYSPRGEIVDGKRIVRSLWLVSRRHGLVGQADVVEISGDGTVTPVEYKRGRPKKDNSDRVQLCAQAICLEEQFGQSIRAGYLFYGTGKRRSEVIFDATLRGETTALVELVRQMFRSDMTPPAQRMPKCEKCSLIELCLPEVGRLKSGAAAWNDRQYALVLAADSPQSDDKEDEQ